MINIAKEKTVDFLLKLFKMTEKRILMWEYANHGGSAPAAFDIYAMDYLQYSDDKAILNDCIYTTFKQGFIYIIHYCLKKDLSDNIWCSHGLHHLGVDKHGNVSDLNKNIQDYFCIGIQANMDSSIKEIALESEYSEQIYAIYHTALKNNDIESAFINDFLDSEI